MRCLRFALWLSLCAILFGTLLAAQTTAPTRNQYGTADKYVLNFGDAFRVGDTLLPMGDYDVTHSMKGDKHMLTFRQRGVETPLEVTVSCTMVKLPTAAPETRKSYVLNDKKERVLKEMQVKGDLSKHVFDEK